MDQIIPKVNKILTKNKLEMRSRKLAVLVEVETRKDILFSPYSSKITQQVKEEAWKEVLERAKLVNLASSKDDWKYVRDQLYNVWKVRTMGKLAAVRTSGVQLGVAAAIKKKLNEVDFKILDIICTSPAIENDCNVNTAHPGDRDTTNNTSQTLGAWERVSKRRIITVMDNYIYKKQALNLQLLRHEIYIRKLTALKLEKDVGLKRSSYNTLKRREMSQNKFYNHIMSYL